MKIYDVVIDDALGIVDGAHTAKLIEDAQTEEIIPPEQFVEVYIKTGVNSDLVADISKGLNTGMQVQMHSILNTDGVFDWLKAELQHQPYSTRISWKESDNGEYDVRDIVGVLECFNIFDFPNEEPKHPIAAYEKWSTPLESFGRDYEDNFKKNKGPAASKYFRMRPLLVQALFLHDVIRRDFYSLHNETGGRAAKLKIVEVASEKKGAFDFPFAGLPKEKYRLTKGALFPILAAFRNCVVFNEPSKTAEWLGGFNSVLALWQKLGLELVAETRSAVKEIGSHPDQIGKSRSHWANLHKTVKLHVQEKRMQLLEQRLREQAA